MTARRQAVACVLVTGVGEQSAVTIGIRAAGFTEFWNRTSARIKSIFVAPVIEDRGGVAVLVPPFVDVFFKFGIDIITFDAAIWASARAFGERAGGGCGQFVGEGADVGDTAAKQDIAVVLAAGLDRVFADCDGVVGLVIRRVIRRVIGRVVRRVIGGLTAFRVGIGLW